MRNFEKIITHTLKWEGGLSRDVNDSASKTPCPTPYNGKTGWHTNKGITYAVWKSKLGSNNDSRFFEMNHEDWLLFYKVYYNSIHGDSFTHDSIAFFVTQIAWGSGSVNAGKQLQKALNLLGAGLKVDGIIGNQTISKANSYDEKELFNALYLVRKSFFESIAKGKNAKFLNGWMNRLNDFKKDFSPN